MDAKTKNAIINDIQQLENTTLLSALWGFFREITTGLLALAKWGSSYARTESSLNKHSYLNQRLKELQEDNK